MADDLTRFSRLVRSRVRKHVGTEREAPPLAVWVSQGADPRRCAMVHVGAAADEAGVRVNIRESVLEADASWVALGRSLATDGGFTTTYGLIVADVEQGVRSWAVEINAGSCGAWVEAGNEDGSIVDLLVGSLRAAAKIRASVARVQVLYPADDVRPYRACRACGRRTYNMDVGDGAPCLDLLGDGSTCLGRFGPRMFTSSHVPAGGQEQKAVYEMLPSDLGKLRVDVIVKRAEIEGYAVRDAPQVECSCAMTEASFHNCPVHGPDAPES